MFSQNRIDRTEDGMVSEQGIALFDGQGRLEGSSHEGEGLETGWDRDRGSYNPRGKSVRTGVCKQGQK